MTRRWASALPGFVMAVGAGLLLGVHRQRPVSLRAPLTIIPAEILGHKGQDRSMSPGEQQVAGVDQYLLRDYDGAFSVYVGYYEEQTQGRTIHSPKNCLPGSGWEPLDASPRTIQVEGRAVTVQRYLLAKASSRALVYYWYQGRGRIAANEYRVKWELLRDAALWGRTEEALVRVVLPLSGEADEPGADSVAAQVAGAMIPALNRALPQSR